MIIDHHICGVYWIIHLYSYTHLLSKSRAIEPMTGYTFTHLLIGGRHILCVIHMVSLSIFLLNGILSTFYIVGCCPVGFCVVGFCSVGFCP